MGLFRLARWLLRRSVLIVGWHGVSLGDEQQRFASLFISPETFRRRLEYLKRHYNVISLDEALHQLAAGKIKPRQVVLTFDDGYYNFLSAAAPILREFGMPATVYLVSKNFCEGEPFHPLVIRDAIARTSLREVTVSMDGLSGPQPLATDADKRRLQGRALAHLESLPREGDERTAFCRTLIGELGLDFDEMLCRRTWNSLNSQEARDLIGQGFSMQLHSHTHRYVTEIPDELEAELVRCRTLVEQATAATAADFCYPGGWWDKGAWPALEAAGIRSATTVRYGPNFARTPALALRRSLDGEDRTQLEFEADVSHVRWLWHAIFHPARWFEPSEKHCAYKQDGTLF